MQVYAAVKTDSDRDVQVEDVIKLLRVRYHSADIDEILGSDTDYDTGRKLAYDFVQRSGLRALPQVINFIYSLNYFLLNKLSSSYILHSPCFSYADTSAILLITCF